MPRVYAIRIAEPALPSLLDSLAESLRYAYLETETAIEWRRFQAGEPIPACVRGRAFGEDCDVQFRQGTDGYDVLVLSDAGRLPLADAETLDLGDFDSEEARYVLWGEGTTDEMCLGILQVTRG